MKLTKPRPAPSWCLVSPVVVAALLWVGLQVLVVLYLRSLVGTLLEHRPVLVIALHQALTSPAGHGLSVRSWIWLVNLGFVLLLWLGLRFRSWPSRGRHAVGLFVYGGASLLLLLTNTAWTRLLR